jgi:hypothetical protein
MTRTTWGKKQNRWWLVVLALGLAGCETTPSTPAKVADFSAMRSFYVVRSADETRGIDAVIVRELDLLGLQATSGAAEARPAGVDGEVRYVARWVDGNLFKLQIEIRPAAAGQAVHAESYLQRKQASGMVQELLAILLPPPAVPR